MRRRRVGLLAVMLLSLSVFAIPAAHAELQRVGPVGFGGYPAWYQDRTGVAMDFCSPLNQSELDGGWCLLLTGDTVAPEVFPNQFFDEHFYWAAGADAGLPGGKALLVLALEGAFAVGPVVPGDQIVFGRIRVRIDPLPASGTYTVYTPFGKFVFPNQAAGDRLFFTEDIGIQCPPGDFNCALSSKIGPFLLPSAAPGGAEVPPIPLLQAGQDPFHDALVAAGGVTPYPLTGKKYIADPGRIGPVTGSPLPDYATASGLRNPNIFRIEGPGGFVLETVDFSLMGRVFEGAMAGQVTVDRASYARTATANKVDVFATGLPSTQARIPAGAPPAQVTPQLQYYDAPCVANLAADGSLLSYSAPAGTAIQMLGSGTNYWGQSAPATVPVGVCVMQTNAVDAGGATVSQFFPTVVGDQIFITEALYDPANQLLSVKASSSDLVTPPTLSVSGFGVVDAVSGQLLVSQLVAPPAKVRVTSSALGVNEMQVTTGVGSSGPGATVPVATNDSVTVAEDSGATLLSVLANDAIGGNPIPAGSIVTLVAQALRGTAVVNVGGTISYTPNANANGNDSFTYTVSVNGIASNVANVAVTVTPVNDPPVAVNDSFTGFANQTITLPVLANDLDVDGAADIVAVANLTQPVGATVTAAGGTLSFLAAAAGTYTFTYQAQDAAGAISANTATVTVTVAATETVNITLAEYRRSQGRLRLTGTVTPVTNPPQRLEVRWANGTNTISVIATPVADAVGNWAVDIRGAVGIQNPDNSGATQVRVSSPGGGARISAITFR